jgi:cell division septal protein FtsQ
MPKKKTTNRRNKRRHVLDVKLASNQVRRRRISFAISSVLMITVLVASIFFLWRGGYWAVQHFVYKNKNLNIEHFEVRTDGVIESRHLINWAGVKPGQNLFAVDLHGIKKNLETHSMIRQVSLERVLPDTLRMQVSEREPVALVRIGYVDEVQGIAYREFALDRTASLMNLNTNIVRRETALAWGNLPWLTTTNFNGVFSEPHLRNPQVVAALDFISSFNSAEIRRNLKIEKIDIDDLYVLRVSASNGATVEILSENYGRQLARWQSIHTNLLLGRQESYTWMDLSVSNNVPVRVIPLNFTNPTNTLRLY